MQVDVGAGLRTWRRRGISAHAGLAARVGFSKIDEALLSYDDGDENPAELGFLAGPEAIVGGCWRFSRSWQLSVHASYAPTWFHRTALHPVLGQVTLAAGL